jgi:tRNA-splicing ligase RtcB
MVNFTEYELEERWNKHAGRPRKNSGFQYLLDGVDLRYLDSQYSRDIVINRKLFRVWHPEARGDTRLIQSLTEISRYPDIFPYVAIMPDYNSGENSVNGSIIPSENLLYLNATGGDIGCGMSVLKLPLKTNDLDGKLEKIYESIYREVPTGRSVNLKGYDSFSEWPLFHEEIEVLNGGNKKEALQQIGTIGRGNHFVEVQEDSEGYLYIMVHTGSRALGQVIRKIFTKKSRNPEKSKNFYYLEANSKDGQNYLRHVDFAVRYATENRAEILRRVYSCFLEQFQGLAESSPEAHSHGFLDVCHNFISKEVHFGREVYVHRKGAVSVPKHSLGIISGTMGDSSFVVEGRGNPYSFNSCSHGAGRRMTRAEALRTLRREDLSIAMEGILSRLDQNVLDEAPQAYKSIQEIVRYQRDLIKIQTKLMPLASIKG